MEWETEKSTNFCLGHDGEGLRLWLGAIHDSPPFYLFLFVERLLEYPLALL